MGKLFQRIENGLRRVCGRMNPDMRVYTIVVLMAVFAGVNIWLTFSAIYGIGREDRRIERLRITPLTIPDSGPEPGGPTELEQDIENYFKQHLKTEENDTIEIQQGEPGL